MMTSCTPTLARPKSDTGHRYSRWQVVFWLPYKLLYTLLGRSGLGYTLSDYAMPCKLVMERRQNSKSKTAQFIYYDDGASKI